MLGIDFFHDTIRKYNLIFGALFNDINIERTDAAGNVIERIKVPLSFAPKDKMLSRLTADPGIDRKAAVQLPRMSFEFGTPYFDTSRKLNPLNKILKCDTGDPNKQSMVYMPQPFNFPYTLYVYSNNIEDVARIVEPIYPRFTPDWTVAAYLLPEIPTLKLDIPIVMGQGSMIDTYEGSLTDRRRVIWQIPFTLKGYLFGPVMTKPVIKFVIGNLKDSASNNIISQVIVQPGLTANGEPTSNVELSIPVSDITINDNYGYVEILNDPYQANT